MRMTTPTSEVRMRGDDMRSRTNSRRQLDYNLLFRWFVGLEMDDPVWNATVFTKNRERLLRGDIARAFFAQVVTQARERGLLSAEHFTVDGTMVEAWASLNQRPLRYEPFSDRDEPMRHKTHLAN
jgi:transposase